MPDRTGGAKRLERNCAGNRPGGPEFQDKSKADNAVKKGFLKDNSLGKLLNVKYGVPHQKIKIKFEVDTNPPAGSNYEVKYLKRCQPTIDAF